MNKPLILVVEDDNSVKNLITTTLKAHDYRYLTAPNGGGAILEASSHNPDIVLLDLGLPDIDGVDVIKKIRTWSNIPIIVISARSEDTDKIDALDAGADDYLTKPFSVEELLARLRVTQRRLNMIQNETAAEASVFTNGKLRIDYAAGCAYLGESAFFSSFLRSFAIKTRREAMSLSQLLPQMFWVIKVWVKTFPIFLESRHKSLYSIGVRCNSSSPK